MGPLSRLVGKPHLSPWLSANVLPLTQVVNNTNSAIPLTEIFDRLFSDVCNSLGFEVQKQKKRGSGNNRVYRNLKIFLNLDCLVPGTQYLLKFFSRLADVELLVGTYNAAVVRIGVLQDYHNTFHP